MRLYWANEDNRRKHSELLSKLHSDKSTRQRTYAAIAAAKRSPEGRRKASEAAQRNVAKVIDTKKRNGSFRTSKAECEFVRFLQSQLGASDVVHQPGRVGRFEVDAYVVSADTFIQFDGVYHHGLDVPYEKLEPARRKKYDRDRAADAWCIENNVKLVRVTDVEWAACANDDERMRLIECRILSR